MRTTATLDKAGRLVLPKAVREALRLGPGDKLEVTTEEDRLVLAPVRLRPGLQKESGIWVFRSGVPAATPLPELIDTRREERSRTLLG
jgi:AbrB family looped-hinge helix DNA binding protein